MVPLKPIEESTVPRALEKAERYRLLNEPLLAESICLDVLALDASNQRALVTYLLALTDQFGGGAESVVGQARAVLPRLADAYERCYYAGIIAERLGHAELGRGKGGAAAAYEHLREAIGWYDQAHRLRPPGNDDAVLRHNTCVRTALAHRLEAPPPDPDEYPGDV